MKKIMILMAACFFCSVYGQAQTPDSTQRPVLNHIALYITDLKTSTWFYETVLGLDSIPEPFHDGRHKWLRMGPYSQLHLIQGAKAPGVHDKNSHTCFSLASVKRFTAVLQKHGIVYENWAGDKGAITTRVDGVQQIYFRDPDGYWIEVNDAK